MRAKLTCIAFTGLLLIPMESLRADWQTEVGFTRLQSLAGSELPTSNSPGLSQIEATEGTTNYIPDSAQFPDKTFTFKSGTTSASSHATTVATNYYGTLSQLPAASSIDVYNVNQWLYSGTGGFLRTSSTNTPVVETRAVQNHSWIGSTNSSDTEICQRLDYAINRDGFVCVVGVNNGASNPLPSLLANAYHTISVGLANGNHSSGLTTVDVAGRMKPEIVAPDSFTSFATPMVSGAAGLLHQKLKSTYSLTGADLPRTVKALLLTSATKNTVPGWDNSSTSPLDSIYGAGELNTWNAYSILRSGRATASNSTLYSIQGWAAESVPGNSTKTYYFTIASGAPSSPFSAGLTWHRNVTSQLGFPLTWSSTLANLNLRLYQATGFTTGTLIASSASSVDNVELIYQPTLTPGNYALVVENASAATTSYALAWHSLPAVTIQATSPLASETTGQAGVMTLTRTGATTLPLYVPLTLSGSAVSGSHYITLPTSVIFAAGSSSTTLDVTPIADSIAQGDRTVTLAVADDFTLVHDAVQSATVTIKDKPFDAWRFANFTSSQLNDSAISGENADPDQDSLQNLMEYALGLPPVSSSPTSVTMTRINGYLAITTAKNTAATDITWTAQVSSNLSDWDTATILTNTASSFIARDYVLTNSASKRFIRLMVTRP